MMVDGLRELEPIPSLTMIENNENVIGLLPAAGQASRVAPLPVSKELFPVGLGPVSGKQGLRPKVAAQYLLEQMQLAGVREVFVVLRKGKWDIPNYFGSGQGQNMHLAYLIMRHPYGVPYTLDEAYPFIHTSKVVFGFPDIIFFPKNTYVRLLRELSESGADIVLGVFPVQRHREKMDMIELDDQNRILRIDIKPEQTRLNHTWIAAAWTPVFTEFMHEFVTSKMAVCTKTETQESAIKQELHMGDIITAGLKSGLHTTIVRFDSGCFLDIGTPEDIQVAADFVRTAESIPSGQDIID
jgi:glucose-1-phosphate thymidylyltransferase